MSIPATARLHRDIHPLLSELQAKLNRPVDVIVIRAIEQLHKLHFQDPHDTNAKHPTHEKLQTLR